MQNLERYDFNSEELSEEELEDVMRTAVSEDFGICSRGVYDDFSHYIEPNGSGYDMIQMIESETGYTAVYFHVGEEVEKEGGIEWDRAVDILSYDPREINN